MKYPRLTYLTIGILLGVLSVMFTVYRYNEEITKVEALHERVHKLSERTIAKLSVERDTLRTEVTNLKTKTKMTERKHADGSSERVYENATESSSETTVIEHERTIAMLEHSLESSKKDFRYQLTLEKKTRPSASLSLGIDKQLTPYVSGTYNFIGSWLLQGYTDYEGNLGVGVGVQF